MKRRAQPIESLTFAGMETAVEEQAKAAGEYSGEQLTARMLEPLADISRKSGCIERDSPLFFGIVDATLFQSLDLG